MKTLKYKGESYQACAPRHIGSGRYICDAVKSRTGREVRNSMVLNGLALLLIRGRGMGDEVSKGNTGLSQRVERL